MSTLYVDTITEKTSGNGVQIADLVPAAGSVVQVVQGLKTDSASTTSISFVNSGLAASITPSSSSSKILIQVTTVLGPYNQKRTHLKLTGGNTATYIGDAGTGVESAVSTRINDSDAYKMVPASMQYLDSPATTSAITYNVQWRVESDTAYMNRPGTLDANGANTASTIILMEIAQ